MLKEKKSGDTISIPLGVIVGVVMSLLLVPISFYFVNKEDNRYVKSVSSPEVLGLEDYISTDEDISVTDSPQLGYFVVLGFNDVYKTIPDEDFSSLITDSKLDKEKFNEYLERKIIPYFETLFGEKELIKNDKGEFMARKVDIVPNYSTIFNKVNEAYVNGIKDIRIDIDSNDGPGTDGKYADRYMEVDNSQQKLYVWENGVVQKVIGLSGPVYGWQVYGVFPIVDKGREPIAPGGKYMPYWMAFHYSKKQDSWYGLHALIWMYKEDGSKWYEPESNIFTRQSAGCIRMVLADAKYLYENFEKGDFLLIHE